MMYERILKSIIVDGIDKLTADTNKLYSILVNSLGLSETEAESFTTYWENDDNRSYRGPPHVFLGYPRNSEKDRFPGYFITLTGESEAERFLGDHIGQVETMGSSGNPRGTPIKGRFYNQQFTILDIAQNPDVCAVYYHLLRLFILSGQDALRAEGVMDVSTQGADLAPNKQWMPDGYFIRSLSVTLMVEDCYEVDDGHGRAWKLDGVHVDRSGAPGEDVGNVKTLVYPYTAEDEP